MSSIVWAASVGSLEARLLTVAPLTVSLLLVGCDRLYVQHLSLPAHSFDTVYSLFTSATTAIPREPHRAAHLCCASLTDWLLPSCFAVLFGLCSVMFVPDAVRAVREMRRVLKNGGVLCLMTWNLHRVEWVSRINRSITAVEPQWKRSQPHSALPDNAASVLTSASSTVSPSAPRPRPAPSLAGSLSTSASLFTLLTAAGFSASDVRVQAVEHAVLVQDAAAFFDSCMSSLPSLNELSQLLSGEEREQVRSLFVQSLHSDQGAAGQTLHLSAEALMALAVKA